VSVAYDPKQTREAVANLRAAEADEVADARYVRFGDYAPAELRVLARLVQDHANGSKEQRELLEHRHGFDVVDGLESLARHVARVARRMDASIEVANRRERAATERGVA
jgi:hypothetical protein